MNATALAAARAYLATAGDAGNLTSQPSAAAPGSDFVTMVKEAIEETSAVGRAADQQMAVAARGQGDMVDVVTAIAETEVTLQTMTTVRDRVISAYQEIINMPI